MSWNTENVQELIEERTEQGRQYLKPRFLDNYESEYSEEEIRMSQSIHQLSSIGNSGRVKTALTNLVAVLPDVNLLSQEQVNEGIEYLEDLRTFKEASEQWNEQYSGVDLDNHPIAFPRLCALEYQGGLHLVVTDVEQERPILFNPRNAMLTRGHWDIGNYKQANPSELEGLAESIDLAMFRNKFERHNMPDVIEETNQLLTVERQSVTTTGETEGSDTESTTEEAEEQEEGDRPNRPWSV